MRRFLATLILTAAALLPAPALASPAPHACQVKFGGQISLGASRTWITSWSGCPKTPVQYNRTQCIYRNVIGTFWYDGPQRTGDGSSNSNYSGVTCNQYPYPSVTQLWIWVNGGGGYAGYRLY